MGDSGSEPISGTAAVAWYENHPTRAAGKSLSLLTIIFWVSEDGSLSKAVGRLEEAILDHVRIKTTGETGRLDVGASTDKRALVTLDNRRENGLLIGREVSFEDIEKIE